MGYRSRNERRTGGFIHIFKEEEVRVDLKEEINRMNACLYREYRFSKEEIEAHYSEDTLLENVHKELFCSIDREINRLYKIYNNGIYDDYSSYSNRVAYTYCRARLHTLSNLTLYTDRSNDKCTVSYVITEDEVIATVKPTKEAISHVEDLIRKLTTDKTQFDKNIFKKLPTTIEIHKTIKNW